VDPVLEPVPEPADGGGQVHHVDAGGGHVVDVEEFAQRGAGAPDHHHLLAALLPLLEAVSGSLRKS